MNEQTEEQKQAHIEAVRKIAEQFGFKRRHEYLYEHEELDIEVDFQYTKTEADVFPCIIREAIREGARRKTKQIREALNIK